MAPVFQGGDLCLIMEKGCHKTHCLSGVELVCKSNLCYALQIKVCLLCKYGGMQIKKEGGGSIGIFGVGMLGMPTDGPISL